MAEIEEKSLEERVAIDLGFDSTDEDMMKLVKQKVMVVKQFLISGGAVQEIFEQANAYGCLCIGVNDLLNNEAGNTNFSPAFHILAKQLF